MQEVAGERREAAGTRAERYALRAWRDVLAVWGISRAFFLVAGAAGHAFLDRADFVGAYRPPPGTFSYWANWDGAWFAHIATHGYDSPSATAFFPLYPIVVRGVTELGPGPALAGMLVSTAASLAALFFVYRLAEHWWDVRVARTATVALALFPPALFLDAVYSEALFLALTAGALWALYVRRDLLVAGAFGYLAAVTRNVGVLLVIPLAWEWLRCRRELGRDAILGVIGPPVGLATYCFYLWKGTHKPLLFAVAQKATWGRTTTSPVVTVRHGWDQAGLGLPYVFHPERVFGTPSVNPPFQLSDTLNFAFLVVVALLLVLAFRRLPLPVWLYCVPVAAAPLLLPGPQIALIGYPRYALAPVPLFLVLGRVLARSRIALAVWLAACAALGLYLTLEFVTWRWVA